MIENLTSLITEAVKTTEGCQRNWDYNYSIPQEHIDTIINTAITMPTKQNEEYYSVVASTDQKFNEKCYLSTDIETNRGRNAQIKAPLLLIWVKNENFIGKDNSFEGNISLNTGICAGGTALVANLLGYRTGFCRCIEQNPVIELLKKEKIFTSYIELALGIGMPDLTMPDRNFIKFGNEIRSFDQRVKNIKVYKI
jgi:hypothetical protein